jgi:1,4-dihydroxy-2-naphthoate octaprenyltransferase
MATPTKADAQPIISRKIRAWLGLSRLPFLSVGVLPFTLGCILTWHDSGTFSWGIGVWGVLGVVIIMLATYYAGEYWDYLEDTLSGRLGGSRFAGGSQVLQRRIVPRHAALYASLVSLVLAVVIGVILQFGYRTGPWTIFLGVVGMIGGFFYSARPVRWVTRGWGELWIALCYGWLPVAVGYYLQTQSIAPIIHWLAIPIGLTIFNVILLNEFPDYQADKAAGKKNLLARLKPTWASRLYSIIGIASWITVLITLKKGVPLKALWFYVPIFIVSVTLVVLVVRGYWRNRQTLEKLCGANLIVNLGTTGVYILAFVT